MNDVIIYTKQSCPYCVAAKALLNKKNIEFKEIDVAKESNLRQEMVRLARGRTTVPQIFINGQHIGGCDDLHALDLKGELDIILKNGD